MIKVKKILAVTGIRSEYDILYPVIRRLDDNPGFELRLVISGAHLSGWHGNTADRALADGFAIADRIDSLVATDRLTQRSKAVANLVSGLTQTVEREQPNMLLVVGDREESIATAIVGNYMDVLVAHIGGGDPVWGNADDPVRMACSKLAHVHFTTAEPYSENLISMGEAEWRICFSGTPGLDNIRNEPVISHQELEAFLGTTLEDYIVVLKHPLSSEYELSHDQIVTTLEAVSAFCSRRGVKAVCITPNSDPGSCEMLQAYKRYEGDTILLKNTLPRSIFINLLRGARALVGNSSMGILEAPMYKLPVVNVGRRQQGRLNAGNVQFVDYDQQLIVDSIEQAAFDESYRAEVAALENPYGAGNAAEIIESFIRSIDLADDRWRVKQDLV